MILYSQKGIFTLLLKMH